MSSFVSTFGSKISRDAGYWSLIPDNKEYLFVLSSIEYQASSIASPQAMQENDPRLVGLRRSFARYLSKPIGKSTNN
jgi:hypothetical protein